MPDPTAAVATYVAEISAKLATGNAAEHAYRPALQRLLEALEEVEAVNDPKHSEFGAPDFIIQKKNSPLVLGWAEAKDLPISLDKTEKGEQLQRYSGYANLFLTNYLEFRFYTSGKRYAEVSIARLEAGVLETEPANYAMLVNELVQFLRMPPQEITSGVHLAEVMGGVARRIRDAVDFYLSQSGEPNEQLEEIFNLIKQLLVHDLDQSRFADMYAQTLVYGLFAARYHDPTPSDFNRAEARDLVPPSNPFLRQFFNHIAGADFDFRLSRIVDEICEIFSVSDVKGIVHRHLSASQGARDPIIHFYEDFLRAYDAEQRKRMGAYYTPLPVVHFIVREVDRVLRDDFGLPAGLSTTEKITMKVERQGKKVPVEYHRVQILDPAVGTATFLNETIKHIHAGFSGQEGLWPAYARDELIPRLNGFELMMAPYTVAHLKLGLTLQESGVTDFGRRLGVYLTNTLEEGLDQPQTLFQNLGLAGAVAHEAVEAGTIKNERPIMVVLGNPPYSGISSNETEFANSLIDHFKVEPGGQVKLRERKHWLNDDYVKFLAFAEQMVRKNRAGVVAMITNNGYLDNPTFRGMRWRLAESFDSLAVINLHGDSKKKERSEDGSADQNVFEIQQGVAILIAVRNPKHSDKKLASVRRADLLGSRSEKFAALENSELEWREVTLKAPAYVFDNWDDTGRAEYEQGIALPDLFLQTSVGVVSGRDSINMCLTRKEIVDNMHFLIDYDDAEIRQKFRLREKDARDWKVATAKADATSHFDEGKIQRCTYRPFDSRYTFYSGNSRGVYASPQQKTIKHMLRGDNIALVFGRRIEQQRPFTDVFVTDQMIQHHTLSLKEVNYFAPLELIDEAGTRESNLNPDARAQIEKAVGRPITDLDVFDYVYASLHSPQFRASNEAFLRMDYPRVPLPRDQESFTRLSAIGARLRELHLLRSVTAKDVITTFPVVGDNVVERAEFVGGGVQINDTQYFGQVPAAAWEATIGGYQPAKKWLSDRKGRALSHDEILHYQQMITALAWTSEITAEIDA